jgi:hypothetical protein
MKAESGASDRAFPGRPLIFAINRSFYLEIAAGRGLPAYPSDARGRARHSVRAEHTRFATQM